ncbi:MAG: class I SAM-dependent methyltransferase [Nitrospira sp.]|nr:class I SAM-dependent methyltransferase [Nitrospira sp.]
MFKNFIDKGIRPYSLHKGLALDFGCGPGPVLATLLKDLGYEVDTYDIHFEPNTGYTEKRYDLITATEILEHLDDPLPVIMSLKNLLNQNGVLAFMTRFHSNDPEAFLNWWYRRDKTHISFYTPKTFRYIAEKASLKILLTDERDTCILSRL